MDIRMKARIRILTFQKYLGHRWEMGLYNRAMLIIEHREPKNRRMCGSLEHWQCYWPAPRWTGWIWIHSYCITIEWGIHCAHLYAKIGSIFR